MKVLMIGPSRNANGGIASVVNEYYKAGLQDLCDLEFLSSTIAGNAFGKILFFLKSISKARKSIDCCDIVHIHVSKNGSFLRKYFYIKEAKKQGKRIVLHIHSSQFLEFYEKSNKIVKQMINSAFISANKVVVLSDYWKNSFKYLVEEQKLIVLPNGIMFSEASNKDYGNLDILFLGKLCKEKGIYDLLESMKDIIAEYPHANLYIGGLGEVDSCKKYSKELGIEKSVHFMGWVSGEEKDKLLMNCSVFVLPSYSEGMPVSLLEAMSYGCACVATDVGSIPEIITDKNGIMINAGSSADMTEALKRLLASSKLRETIGTAAVENIRNRYDEKKIVKQLVTIYESLR